MTTTVKVYKCECGSTQVLPSAEGGWTPDKCRRNYCKHAHPVLAVTRAAAKFHPDPTFTPDRSYRRAVGYQPETDDGRTVAERLDEQTASMLDELFRQFPNVLEDAA